jgi:hypothetical protein
MNATDENVHPQVGWVAIFVFVMGDLVHDEREDGLGGKDREEKDPKPTRVNV